MKIRAQIGMVLNLDKCIGCHTCSVTCKNVWTSRPGMEYAWFNNVETKPGIGYPKEWENQDKWNGGWVRKADGSHRAAPGRQVEAADAHLRQPEPAARSTTTTSPSPSTTSTCRSAPEMKAAPTARPRSLITGKQHGEDRLGPELGGDPRRRILQALARTANFDDMQKDIYGQFENTFMMYLPRLCEHCLNPACVASLPLGLDLQARGRRHRADRPGQVPRLAHVRLAAARTRRSTTTGRAARPRSASSATRASKPASRRCARETCVGPHPLPRRAAVRRRPHPGGGERRARPRPVPGAARHLPRPARPEGDRAGAHRRHSRGLDRGGAQQPGLQDGGATGRSRCRCTPSTARCRWSGTCRRCRRSARPPTPAMSASTASFPTSTSCASRSSTSPTCSPPATPAPVVRALERMLAMRAYQREQARRRTHQPDGAEAGRHHRGRGGGHVPGHGDRQLRGPLRHPDAPTASTRRTRSTCAAAAASPSATAAPTAPARPACSAASKKRTIPIQIERFDMPKPQPRPATLRALALLLGYPGCESAPPTSGADARATATPSGALAATAPRRTRSADRQARCSWPTRWRSRPRYVELFDRGRGTSLHLFEHVHGDSRDRGPAMIDLRKTYEKAGLRWRRASCRTTCRVVLEFASTQPAREARAFLGEMAHILKAIFSALRQRDSAYAALLAAAAGAGGREGEAVPFRRGRTAGRQLGRAAWPSTAAPAKGQAAPGQPQPIQHRPPGQTPRHRSQPHERQSYQLPLRRLPLYLPRRCSCSAA